MKRSELKQLIEEVVSEIVSQGNRANVQLDAMGEPVGYKYLGMLNSGIKLPKTNDWQRFYVSSSGNTEKFLSPQLKVWYDVDSSG